MTRNQFSERIRQLREQKGITQAELAEKSGLTIRSIQRLEKGENTPRGDTLKRIGEVFDVPVESLFVKELDGNVLYLILLSLSPLGFLIRPEFSIVFPFFLWLFKRKSIKNVEQLGRQVLNFQLSWVLIYYYFPLLLSFVVQVILAKGSTSELNITELLLKRVFIYSMFLLNIVVTCFSSYFVHKDGKSRILKGFAYKGLKIRPVILSLYVLLVGVLISGIVFPRKNYIDMEKAEVIRFAKETLQIEYKEDGSHTDILKKYLNPLLDSSRTRAILHGMFIPWGEVKSNTIEIMDHGFSRSGRIESHYVHIIYTDTGTQRLFRYLLQVDKINGRYYISDYFSENMADTFFEKVKLKKKNGYLFWKVPGLVTYRKVRELKEGEPALYRLEDGKLKKQKIN